ncbi:MAG: DNA polymerase III subunit delta [Alphaproteobacteria bacterium]|jgi:DNA polymerase-3 subunit delta|nr:DNA polymerase III subunit delta [Alphaproteobacteria bacterium]
MKLDYKNTDSFLKSIPANIKAVLVYGPDEGQVREKIHTISKLIVEDLSDPFNVVDITSSEACDSGARISDEMNSMSLMGGRKLIRIGGADKSLKSSIENALADYDGDNFLIIEGKELSPSSPVRKMFETSKNMASLACYIQDERNLSYSIPKIMSKLGKTLERDAVQYLSSCLVGDSGSVSSQLEKLAIYAGDNKLITLEDAKACIIDSSDVSIEKIAQKAAGGDFSGLEKDLAKSFAEGITSVAVLRVSQNYFKKLHLVKSQIEEGKAVDEALKSLRPPLFFKDKPVFLGHLNKWSSKRIMSAINGLIKAETLCKKTGYPTEIVCSHTLHSIAKIARR